MTSNSTICEYEHWYTDTKTRKYVEYICDRVSLPNNKFCKFHNDTYFQTHEDEMREMLIEELNNTVSRAPIYFIGYHVPSIIISKINNDRSIYFTNSKFHGDVEFYDGIFKIIDFTDAKFEGKFQMMSVDVTEIFSFTNTTWKESEKNVVEFELCNLKKTNFSINTVNSISFKCCKLDSSKFRTFTFRQNMVIDDSIFTGKVDFSDGRFCGKLTVSNTTFHSNTSFQYSEFSNIAKFHNVDFKEQSLVIFEGDLTNLSFIGTDITRIKFGGNTIWGGNDKYTIADDTELVKNPEKFNLSSVLAVYRNLRENYEFHLMYEEAGQFFVKEMELKRIYFQDSSDDNKTKIKKIKRYFSITNCYNVLSKYGESLKRVSVWSLILFSAALIYFFIYPDIFALNEAKPIGKIDYSTKLSEDLFFRFEISLERTLSSFFQINKGRLADYVIRIISLPILGVLFIVLRRRFERRFRH